MNEQLAYSLAPRPLPLYFLPSILLFIIMIIIIGFSKKGESQMTIKSHKWIKSYNKKKKFTRQINIFSWSNNSSFSTIYLCCQWKFVKYYQSTTESKNTPLLSKQISTHLIIRTSSPNRRRLEIPSQILLLCLFFCEPRMVNYLMSPNRWIISSVVCPGRSPSLKDLRVSSPYAADILCVLFICDRLFSLLMFLSQWKIMRKAMHWR